MEAAQAAINAAGRGVIIYLDQEGKGNGHLALIKSIPYKKAGMNQSEAYERAGFSADARSCRAAAEIINDLRVQSIVLLTDNAGKADELREHSVTVTEIRPVLAPQDLGDVGLVP